MIRRECLAALALSSLWPQAARSHGRIGPVRPPVPAPDIRVLDHLGKPRQMRAWMSGKLTVLQTIFTGCSSVCPIQGAMFAELQRQISTASWRHPVQLMSMSIDALGDTPEALSRWLVRMGAAPNGWVAAVPRVDDVDILQRALSGSSLPAQASLDAHRDQVFFFDAQAHLRWRSTSLPSVKEVLDVLRDMPV